MKMYKYFMKAMLLLLTLFMVDNKFAVANCTCRGELFIPGMVDIHDYNAFLSLIATTGPSFIVGPPPPGFECADLAFPDSEPILYGDEIKVIWYENTTQTFGGFSDFHLNISTRNFLNFVSPVEWTLTGLDADDDGSGGIDITGGSHVAPTVPVSGEIFTCSFQVNLDMQPLDTITISPVGNGTWFLYVTNNLPDVVLPVIATCPNPPTFDVSGDCLFNLLDLAQVFSEWLDCGYEPPSTCP